MMFMLNHRTEPLVMDSVQRIGVCLFFAWGCLPAWNGAAASEPPQPAQLHWAFRPVQSQPVPSVTNSRSARNPVDQFVLTELEAAGIQPGAAADRATLLRRVSLDLVGLRALTHALRRWPGGLVVASHDRAFLEELHMDRTIVLGRVG